MTVTSTAVAALPSAKASSATAASTTPVMTRVGEVVACAAGLGRWRVPASLARCVGYCDAGGSPRGAACRARRARPGAACGAPARDGRRPRRRTPRPRRPRADRRARRARWCRRAAASSVPKSPSSQPPPPSAAEPRCAAPQASSSARASSSPPIMRHLAGRGLGPVRQRHRARSAQARRRGAAGAAGAGRGRGVGRRVPGGRPGGSGNRAAGSVSGGSVERRRGTSSGRHAALALDRRLGLVRAEDADALGGRRLGGRGSQFVVVVEFGHGPSRTGGPTRVDRTTSSGDAPAATRWRATSARRIPAAGGGQRPTAVTPARRCPRATGAARGSGRGARRGRADRNRAACPRGPRRRAATSPVRAPPSRLRVERSGARARPSATSRPRSHPFATPMLGRADGPSRSTTRASSALSSENMSTYTHPSMTRANSGPSRAGPRCSSRAGRRTRGR